MSMKHLNNSIADNHRFLVVSIPPLQQCVQGRDDEGTAVYPHPDDVTWRTSTLN